MLCAESTVRRFLERVGFLQSTSERAARSSDVSWLSVACQTSEEAREVNEWYREKEARKRRERGEREAIKVGTIWIPKPQAREYKYTEAEIGPLERR